MIKLTLDLNVLL